MDDTSHWRENLCKFCQEAADIVLDGSIATLDVDQSARLSTLFS
jgi:hypothetical protein